MAPRENKNLYFFPFNSFPLRPLASWKEERDMRAGTLVILVSWTIWCERNSRIFEHKEKTVTQTIAIIKEQIRLWILGGAKHLARLL